MPFQAPGHLPASVLLGQPFERRGWGGPVYYLLLVLAPAPVSEQARRFSWLLSVALHFKHAEYSEVPLVHTAHKFTAVAVPVAAFMPKSFPSAKYSSPLNIFLLVPDVHWLNLKQSESGVAPACLGFHFTLYIR